MTQPYDGEGDEAGTEDLAHARHALGLPDDLAEDEETLDTTGIPPIGPEGLFPTMIAKLDLGPRDVLAVVAAPGIKGGEIGRYSDVLAQALHNSGHDNLVLVFPNGTKLKKVTLDEKQMNALRRQVGSEGDAAEHAETTPFGGFARNGQ